MASNIIKAAWLGRAAWRVGLVGTEASRESEAPSNGASRCESDAVTSRHRRVRILGVAACFIPFG
ncbi:hypothetical protein DSM104299_03635 [Baekduia alba]|nr:hypothetical protein DSM104299_03635 [Baekduia alba]